MKKWIGRFLVIAFVLALVNDFGRYLVAMYTLDQHGRNAAFEAGRIARQDGKTNSGWPTAWQIAHDNGFEIISYRQDRTGVVAVGRIWVVGTFIVGPVHAIATEQPLSTPFSIEQTFQSSE